MYIALTKNDLQKLISHLSGVVADELELLDAVIPFCDDLSDIKNSKILFLVGSGRLYPVKGVSFDNKQELIETIKDGDILHFVKEPENEYDKNAIKIVFNENHVGYISRKLSGILQDCINDLCGEVIHVVGTKEDNQNLGLRFVFRRKESIGRKQLVSLDTVSYLLEDIQEKNKHIITTAQMLNIINNEYQPSEIDIDTKNNSEAAPVETVIPPKRQANTSESIKKEEDIF